MGLAWADMCAGSPSSLTTSRGSVAGALIESMIAADEEAGALMAPNLLLALLWASMVNAGAQDTHMLLCLHTQQLHFGFGLNIA